jgi:hypothetical protein
MRTASLQLAGREVDAGNEDEDRFVTNTEVDRWINMAVKELFGLLTRHGMHPDETTYELEADGSETYTLPADTWAILTVHAVSTDGYRTRLTRHGHRFAPNPADTGDAQTYRVIGRRTLQLYPLPTSGDYEIRYAGIPATLVDDDDELDGVLGWEEYVHAWVARRILMKEGSDLRDVNETLMDLRQRIQDEAQTYEMTEGTVVANTRAEAASGGLPGDYVGTARPRWGW